MGRKKANKKKPVTMSSVDVSCPTASEEKDGDWTDNVGRMFCKHGKDYCHICCVDHRMCNKIMEENAGLRKKESELEEAARMYATACSALRGMEQMRPRPSKEVFDQNIRWRDEYKAKIDAFAESSPGGNEEVLSAVKKAIDQERGHEIEKEAMIRAFAKLNPGKTTFEYGGEESQKIYDDYVKGPVTKSTRGDFYTCAYCHKTGTVVLMQCSRCKKVSYCSKECQTAAWPSHKKNECIKSDKEAKQQRLTWDQVEAHSGKPAPGKLEVRAILDESMMRQVFQCKDRVGVCKRVAVYTNSRAIPGLRVGATVTWKNPRFHYFMDGSSGARIEEEDLPNVTVV